MYIITYFKYLWNKKVFEAGIIWTKKKRSLDRDKNSKAVFR